MKSIKFNQCQDCGCPGGKLITERLDDRWSCIKCPYCGRRGYSFASLTRGMTKIDLWRKIVSYSWNSLNRENEEGLA